MFFEILTLFPEMFNGPFNSSIIKRAVDKGLIQINIVNFRDFAKDRHKTVDDIPYGGQPGMLLKPEPLVCAIKESKNKLKEKNPKVICLSAQGLLFTHEHAEMLSKEDSLILICGHYKGIDQRVIDKYVDMEICIGDYILSGGEIPAMVVVDAVTRLIPGVLGNNESASKDSFFNGLLSPPQYTRPYEFEGMKVPDILLSGHHEKIRKWQKEQSERITKQRRPDLWKKYIKKI